MSVMDGITSAREIRKIKTAEKTFIIALSGSSESEEKEKCF